MTNKWLEFQEGQNSTQGCAKENSEPVGASDGDGDLTPEDLADACCGAPGAQNTP